MSHLITDTPLFLILLTTFSMVTYRYTFSLFLLALPLYFFSYLFTVSLLLTLSR